MTAIFGHVFLFLFSPTQPPESSLCLRRSVDAFRSLGSPHGVCLPCHAMDSYSTKPSSYLAGRRLNSTRLNLSQSGLPDVLPVLLPSFPLLFRPRMIEIDAGAEIDQVLRLYVGPAPHLPPWVSNPNPRMNSIRQSADTT